MKEYFEKKGREITDQIKANFDSKGLTATGATKNSVVFEATSKTLVILGASYIANTEFGRPPAKGNDSGGKFLENLKKWIKVRGLDIKPESLQYLINKFGTRQYQKGSGNGVVSEIVNQGLIKEVEAEITKLSFSSVSSEIDNFLKKTF